MFHYDDPEEELKKVQRELAESRKRETLLRSLCIAVRLAQVDYFANRCQQALIRSKGAESRLDKELFGQPLKPRMLMRTADGELGYHEQRKADGDVPGASPAEGADARHTISILGSGEGAPRHRR